MKQRIRYSLSQCGNVPLIAFCLLIGTVGTATALSNIGRTAAPFLTISIGARAQGMGGAFVGLADDAAAIYWNPAGISRQDRTQILLVREDMFAGMTFDYAGFLYPFSRHQSIGLAMALLDVGEMEVTTVLEPEGTGELFLSHQLALNFTYGVNFTDRFSFGASLKYIEEKIWHEKATAVGYDIGTLFRTPFNDLTIGVTVCNIGQDMRMEGQDLYVGVDLDPDQTGNNSALPTQLRTELWPLPLIFRVGVSQGIRFNRHNRLTYAIDAEHPIDNEESMNLGCEYAFRERFFIRSGFQHLFLPYREGGLTAGAGVRMPVNRNLDFGVDYAWQDRGRLGNTQRFSLLLLW